MPRRRGTNASRSTSPSPSFSVTTAGPVAALAAGAPASAKGSPIAPTPGDPTGAANGSCMGVNWADGSAPTSGLSGVSEARALDTPSSTIATSSGNVLSGIHCFEAVAPHERLLGDRPGRGFGAELAQADGTDRDTIDADVPFLGSNEIRQTARLGSVDRLCERTGQRARAGDHRAFFVVVVADQAQRRGRAIGACSTTCVDVPFGRGCGNRGRLGRRCLRSSLRCQRSRVRAPRSTRRRRRHLRGRCARGAGRSSRSARGRWRVRRGWRRSGRSRAWCSANLAGRPRCRRSVIGGELPRDRAVGHGLANLDHVAALAALHPHRAARDLFVGDLVLRLAAGTEELHSAGGPGLGGVSDGERIARGPAPRESSFVPCGWLFLPSPGLPRRQSGSPDGQRRLRRCCLIDWRVLSSGARPSARSHISAALFLNPAFWYRIARFLMAGKWPELISTAVSSSLMAS